MKIYTNHFTRMPWWYRNELWIKRKLMKTNNLTHAAYLYPPLGGIFGHVAQKHQIGEMTDHDLMLKFVAKYPDAAEAYHETPRIPDTYTISYSNPAMKFVKKQRYYMNNGIIESKAFEMAEKDMSSVLTKERKERALMEGIATSNRVRSLLSYYEQELEFEARQKVTRLGREIGEFKRYDEEENRKMDALLGRKKYFNSADKEAEVESRQMMDAYKPVSHEMVDPSEEEEKKAFEILDQKDGGVETEQGLRKRLSFTPTNTEIKKQFIQDTEKLVKFVRSFAEVSDGITNLTDKEIIIQANTTPKRLKESLRGFLKKCLKYQISLDSNGELDLSKVTGKHILEFVKKHETAIKTCLYSQDLNFEFPHATYQTKMRAKLLRELKEEEKRINLLDEEIIAERNRREVKIVEERQSYDGYFGNKGKDAEYRELDDDLFGDEGDISKKQLNFTGNETEEERFLEWKKRFGEKYLFDTEHERDIFKYWENPKEKELRLKKIWLETKKSRTIQKSLDSPTSEEVQKLNLEIVGLVRNIRYRIDQQLLKDNKHPVFGANYRNMDRSEFLMDVELEFIKIKKYLQKTNLTLKQDPELGDKYKELIQVLKKRRYLDYSINPYRTEDKFDYLKEDKTRILSRNRVEKVLDKETSDDEEQVRKPMEEDLFEKKFGEDFLHENIKNVSDAASVQKIKEKMLTKFKDSLRIMERNRMGSKKDAKKKGQKGKKVAVAEPEKKDKPKKLKLKKGMTVPKK